MFATHGARMPTAAKMPPPTRRDSVAMATSYSGLCNSGWLRISCVRTQLMRNSSDPRGLWLAFPAFGYSAYPEDSRGKPAVAA